MNWQRSALLVLLLLQLSLGNWLHFAVFHSEAAGHSHSAHNHHAHAHSSSANSKPSAHGLRHIKHSPQALAHDCESAGHGEHSSSRTHGGDCELYFQSWSLKPIHLAGLISLSLALVFVGYQRESLLLRQSCADTHRWARAPPSC